MAEKLNALRLDTETGAITLPCGGTGRFTMDLTVPEGIALTPGTDVAVLGIGQKDEDNPQAYVAISRMECAIRQRTDGSLYVLVEFVNADTRTIAPGTYAWDLTIVTDPERDANGMVIVDDASDNVYPVYAASDTGKLPKFTLRGAVPVV